LLSLLLNISANYASTYTLVYTCQMINENIFRISVVAVLQTFN